MRGAVGVETRGVGFEREVGDTRQGRLLSGFSLRAVVRRGKGAVFGRLRCRLPLPILGRLRCRLLVSAVLPPLEKAACRAIPNLDSGAVRSASKSARVGRLSSIVFRCWSYFSCRIVDVLCLCRARGLVGTVVGRIERGALSGSSVHDLRELAKRRRDKGPRVVVGSCFG